MWLLCLGVLGGLLLLYGGQELLYRGRGGRMTKNGLIALLAGMVLVGCLLLAIIAPIADAGGNMLASIPISDELKLLLFCAFLIFGLIALLVLPFAISTINENNRKSNIMAHQNEWSKEICQTLINKKISTGMTEEMVRLAWGNPNYIEDKELTERGKTVRWIYGQPRKGANYVWFTNGKATKIKG